MFLGHPIYGLAIGLFGIILSTGIGSLLVSSFRALSSARLLLWVATLGLYLILLPLWFPEFSATFASADLFMRAMVSLVAIIPSGVLMGFGFPIGMEIVNAIDSASDAVVLGGQRRGGRAGRGSGGCAQHRLLDQRDAVGRRRLLPDARPGRGRAVAQPG